MSPPPAAAEPGGAHTAPPSPGRRLLHLLAALLAAGLALHNLLGASAGAAPAGANPLWLGAAAACMAAFFLLQNHLHRGNRWARRGNAVLPLLAVACAALALYGAR